MRWRLLLVVPILTAVSVASPSLADAAPTGPAAGDSGTPTLVDVPTSYYDDAAVNVASGNLFVTAQDGSQTLGDTPNLPYVRYYNSQTTVGSEFGTGWSLSVGPDVHLVPAAQTVTAYMPSGAVATFTLNADGTYSSDQTDANLSKSDTGYILNDTFGTTDTFDSSGVLTAVQSPDGGQATVNDATSGGTPILNNVFDAPDDLSLQLGSVTGGKAVNLFDGAGGESQYGYNSSGQLGSFTNTDGTTTTYQYNSAGLLNLISEADGTTESIAYNGSVVSGLTVSPAGGGAGYGDSFQYEAADPGVCNADDIGETIVTPIDSSDGAVTTYCYTAAGVVDSQHDADPGLDSGVNYNGPGGGSPAPVPPPIDQSTGSAGTSPATTVVKWHVFNIKKHQYNWDPRTIVADVGSSIRTKADPHIYAWGFDLAPALRAATDGPVTPQAFGYNYDTKKRLLVNGTPYTALGKPESKYYFFHSSMPGVGDGQTYQLAVNIVGQPCKLYEGCLYNAWLRLNFRVVK